MTTRAPNSALPVNKNTRIAEMIRSHPATIGVLEELGLWCPECALVGIATVEMGAERHNLNLEKLIHDLNQAATRPHHKS